MQFADVACALKTQTAIDESARVLDEPALLQAQKNGGTPCWNVPPFWPFYALNISFSFLKKPLRFS